MTPVLLKLKGYKFLVSKTLQNQLAEIGSCFYKGFMYFIFRNEIFSEFTYNRDFAKKES